VAEGIVLKVLVGCHGCNKEEALEGGRGQLDGRASLLEAFEIDQGSNAAAGAAVAVFRDPPHENRRLVSNAPSVKTALDSFGVCFSLL
jgi:hypothetical protein